LCRRTSRSRRAGVQWNFARLRNVHVRLVFAEAELAALRPQVQAFAEKRRQEIAEQSDENVDSFTACIECQSFSHSHVCVVTPDRPPMCGRRPGQVRAAALFGATWHPYRRRGLKARELREVVPKGRCLDPERGEWEGINEAASRLTDGQIERVFLHSLREFPHSSCGCFHYLAFRLDDQGLGIMNRGFGGAAPNGATWREWPQRRPLPLAAFPSGRWQVARRGVDHAESARGDQRHRAAGQVAGHGRGRCRHVGAAGFPAPEALSDAQRREEAPGLSTAVGRFSCSLSIPRAEAARNQSLLRRSSNRMTPPAGPAPGVTMRLCS